MRPLASAAFPVLAGLVLELIAPVPAAASPPPAATVLVVADVGESAQRTMPSAMWRKLVVDYLGARPVVAEDGTALPDDAHCKSARAAYAVFATFDRAMRLPGFAQDTDRAYGIARFTVRNCLTGTVAPTKTVRIESEPLPEAARGEGDGIVAAEMWRRAVRASLAHEPLVLAPAKAVGTIPIAAGPVGTVPGATPLGTAAPAATGAPVAAAGAPAATGAPVAGTVAASAPPGRIARIASIVDGVAFLDNGKGFAVNQLLRDYADRDAHPHAPIQLVVVEVTRRYVAATVVGNGTPHAGDYVDATPVK